jgi:alcohol dehydrogenase class IV
MAVEGLESAAGDSLSDAMLMHALRLLKAELPRLEERPEDAGLRAELILAAVLCGRGTDYTGGGLASVLGHATGARFDVDNGMANAILLPHSMRFNLEHTAPRLGKILASLSDAPPCPTQATAHDAVAAVERFLSSLNARRRLRDVGVPRDALHSIAEHAMADWFVNQVPRRVDGPADLVSLLEAAW